MPSFPIYVGKSLVSVPRPRAGSVKSPESRFDRRLPHGLGHGHGWKGSEELPPRPQGPPRRQCVGGLLLDSSGVLRSRPLSRLAHQMLLWSEGNLHIPEDQNQRADMLSRQGLRPGEWRLHTEVVKSICERIIPVEVDLFASRGASHCPLWFSLTHPAPLGLDATVQTWPRLRLYAFPPIALLLGVLDPSRWDQPISRSRPGYGFQTS